jgi:hypothetical protein
LLAAPVQFDPPARAKDFDMAGTASRVHRRGTGQTKASSIIAELTTQSLITVRRLTKVFPVNPELKDTE